MKKTKLKPYLGSRPRKAHVRVLRTLGGVGSQSRGLGVLGPNGGAEVRNLKKDASVHVERTAAGRVWGGKKDNVILFTCS